MGPFFAEYNCKKPLRADGRHYRPAEKGTLFVYHQLLTHLDEVVFFEVVPFHQFAHANLVALGHGEQGVSPADRVGVLFLGPLLGLGAREPVSLAFEPWPRALASGLAGASAGSGFLGPAPFWLRPWACSAGRRGFLVTRAAIFCSRLMLSRRFCRAATLAESSVSLVTEPALPFTASNSFSKVTRRSMRLPTSFSSLATLSAVPPKTASEETAGGAGGWAGKRNGPQAQSPRRPGRLKGSARPRRLIRRLFWVGLCRTGGRCIGHGERWFQGRAPCRFSVPGHHSRYRSWLSFPVWLSLVYIIWPGRLQEVVERP